MGHYHLKLAFVHYIKSTRKILAQVRPPPPFFGIPKMKKSSGPRRGSSDLIKEEIKKRQRVAVGNKGTSSQVGRTVSAQSQPCASTTPYDNYASEKIVFVLVYFLHLFLYLYPTPASYP